MNRESNLIAAIQESNLKQRDKERLYALIQRQMRSRGISYFLSPREQDSRLDRMTMEAWRKGHLSLERACQEITRVNREWNLPGWEMSAEEFIRLVRGCGYGE